MDLEAPLLGTCTIALDVDLALKGQGLPPSARPGERVVAAARRAVEHGAELIQPRFLRVSAAVVRRTAETVQLEATTLRGEAITAALEGADCVVTILCTIGSSLDRRVSSLLASDPLLALALDGLGSAACERLAVEVRDEIARRAGGDGNRVTGPLSPGMLGWPLREAQRQLFALVDPAPLGVVLTPSGQMIPRKTLSFVVGVGPRVRAQPSCPACGVRDRCTYRRDHA